MAALGRPFSGLPLSGGSDFLQPPPAFSGRAFPPGTDGAELAPRPGPRVSPNSPARGRVSVPCKKKHKLEREDDDGRMEGGAGTDGTSNMGGGSLEKVTEWPAESGHLPLPDGL